MRLVVDVWIPGHPVTKGSHTRGRAGQYRPAHARELAVWSDETRKRVRDAATGVVESTEYAYIHCGFWVDIGDGDKLERAVWDAVTRAKVWPDDVRAVIWSGYRYFGDGQSDGAHVQVHAIGQREYERFRREARTSVQVAYQRTMFGNVKP